MSWSRRPGRRIAESMISGLHHMTHSTSYIVQPNVIHDKKCLILTDWVWILWLKLYAKLTGYKHKLLNLATKWQPEGQLGVLRWVGVRRNRIIVPSWSVYITKQLNAGNILDSTEQSPLILTAIPRHLRPKFLQPVCMPFLSPNKHCQSTEGILQTHFLRASNFCKFHQ